MPSWCRQQGRQYNTANAIILRLARVIDDAALSAIRTGVTLALGTEAEAQQSAQALAATIDDANFTIKVEADPAAGTQALRIAPGAWQCADFRDRYRFCRQPRLPGAVARGTEY